MKDNEWKNICAACAEGTPPERCAYYGDPDGCNAPTLGKHPEGDLAERLQEALEKAERRIAELERALGNASALRKALIRAKRDHWFNMTPELRDEIYDALTSELPSNTVSMRAALQSVNRTMEIEARINCTEKGELGKFGNTQSELCKRCRARNCECWQMTLKREVESALASTPEQPSNAAALREALEKIARWDDGIGADISNIARAALAAPARNCDRFATANDAVKGYIAAHPHDDEPDASTYGSWLFATAEGGDHA